MLCNTPFNLIHWNHFAFKFQGILYPADSFWQLITLILQEEHNNTIKYDKFKIEQTLPILEKGDGRK